MFKKVGIVGLGLIGGSLCKVLRARCGAKEIVVASRSLDVLIQAKSEGVIDDYSQEITHIFCGCDIVFICTPVDKIVGYAKELLPFVGNSCIITDVGSTKNKIFEQMQELGRDIKFIGGHPMTGSEKFRYSASKEHLFENAYYIMTPSSTVPERYISAMKAMIEKMGAIPVVMKPDEHDRVVASISHVPHIIASSLVNMVKKLDTDSGHMHLLAAGGFKDTTRIASSNPDMWKSILLQNKKEILPVLDELENTIDSLRKNLEGENKDGIYSFFDEARMYRNSFAHATPGGFIKRYEIVVDVLDKLGSIAIIAVLFSSNGINIKNLGIINHREIEGGALLISFDKEADRKKSVELLREMNYEVYIKE